MCHASKITHRSHGDGRVKLLTLTMFNIVVHGFIVVHWNKKIQKTDKHSICQINIFFGSNSIYLSNF